MVFSSLLLRELKAFLKNPAFVVSIVIILSFYTFMGRVIYTGTETAVREVERASIGVVIEDLNDILLEALKILNKTYSIKLYSSPQDGFGESVAIIVFPHGFVENITSNGTVRLRTYVSVSGLNLMVYQVRVAFINRFIDDLSNAIVFTYGNVHNVTLPIGFRIETHNSAVFQDKTINEYLFNTIVSFASFAPLLVGLMMGINASYSSQITAVEKDEKAFEMLLAQPVSRRNIVLAKIIASITASIINGLVLLIALILMGAAQVTLIEQTPRYEPYVNYESLENISFTNTILVLLFSLVIGLVYSGAMGVIVGSIVHDTRTAGVLTTPLMLIFMGFSLVPLFMGLPVSETLSILYGVFVTPLTYLYMYSTLSGNLSYFAIGIASSITTCLSLIALSIYVFERDIVVTGLRISFKKIPVSRDSH
ncbi:MAG: ABC transporter permease [Desulfurococcaceae archaeon]